jgi:hypothetical protein
VKIPQTARIFVMPWHWLSLLTLRDGVDLSTDVAALLGDWQWVAVCNNMRS